MREVSHDGKTVTEEPWRPISAEEKNSTDSRGWFDMDGEVDASGLDPGIYELRVSVKDARSNKTVQRTTVFGIE